MFLPFLFCLTAILSLLLTYSWSSCLSNTGKERWGRIVEWVEKVSFARLNKLFEIDTVERAHNVLLLDKNLQNLIKNPKSFIIPVFPWLVSLYSVPDEHIMLKNLHFYEVCSFGEFWSTLGSSRRTWEKNVKSEHLDNLQYLIKNPKSFIIPVFPCRL